MNSSNCFASRLEALVSPSLVDFVIADRARDPADA